MHSEAQPLSPSVPTAVSDAVDASPSAEILAPSPGRHQVIRRNGKVTHFIPLVTSKRHVRKLIALSSSP